MYGETGSAACAAADWACKLYVVVLGEAAVVVTKCVQVGVFEGFSLYTYCMVYVLVSAALSIGDTLKLVLLPFDIVRGWAVHLVEF